MDFSSVSALLTPVFGVRAAGYASIVVLVLFIVAHLMAALPVPSSTSPAWYAVPFGILTRLTGGWGNAAPMPPTGTLPAGGVMPTPPALQATSTVIPFKQEPHL